MKRNDEWHSKNKISENPTIDQRVRWHIEHARHCPCQIVDDEILQEVENRYMNTHQEFWVYFNINDHKSLALWAADSAERVLPYFETKYPQDPRPREAITILIEWVNTGKFSMPVIRGASLAAHAAARDVNKTDDAARFAARAAGQSVATAHVPTHAFGAALYAIKAVAAANPMDFKPTIDEERDWQYERLPENLREWAISGLKKNERLLRANLRN